MTARPASFAGRLPTNCSPGRGAHGPFHPDDHAALSGMRDFRLGSDRRRGDRRLPHGVRALCAQSQHHLADRLHHLQLDCGDIHRQPLCAVDPRPRQCRRAAALSRPTPAILSGAGFRHHGAGLLRGDDGPDLPVLARSLDRALGLRHDVARAVVDSLCVDAGRFRPCFAAIRGRADQARHRPRAALRHQTGRDADTARGRSGGRRNRHPTERGHMSPTTQGTIVLIETLVVLLSGAPVAFGLGAIAISFLVIFQGTDALRVAAETFYAGLNDFTLVSIPMFVMMGAAIGSSPAGKDLYEALDRWLYRVPGGLVISNIGACAIFAALTGSSPACCAAIGKMGIPEMRRRGYPDDVATGSICAGGTLGILIPPSITFILYGIATETSIGRLFLAGVLPGLMLTGLFILWTLFIIWRRGFRAHAADFRYTWKEKFQSIPKIAPFLLIIFGVMYTLYRGVATPSEAAGVGAALCILMAILIYRMWAPEKCWLILRDTTPESVMILMIMAAALLFGYMPSSLYLTQTLAQAIADMHVNKWVLMLLINLFLLVSGFFIPPAAIILMTSPILYPIITTAGFDPVWFGVVMTINMEIGLIHPPVGLNIYIVSSIAPDVPVTRVMWGTIPYVICMMLAIVILCVFPEIATWLPDRLMGPVHR